jgi:hypothetical protein
VVLIAVIFEKLAPLKDDSRECRTEVELILLDDNDEFEDVRRVCIGDNFDETMIGGVLSITVCNPPILLSRLFRLPMIIGALPYAPVLVTVVSVPLRLLFSCICAIFGFIRSIDEFARSPENGDGANEILTLIRFMRLRRHRSCTVSGDINEEFDCWKPSASALRPFVPMEVTVTVPPLRLPLEPTPLACSVIGGERCFDIGCMLDIEAKMIGEVDICREGGECVCRGEAALSGVPFDE